ncbi:MAG TPA: DEAD/DEAH box helicase family protein [Clostridiales bacterium]|nr:DEAD/DEAH box helicase family protein [Clostridiales bacterium]
MFYEMISKKRDEWLASDDCQIKSLMNYIVSTGKMRDAQTDAIATYLFLKIACDNKPLSRLFYSGTFNSLDVQELELRESTRSFLNNNPGAIALLEYASLTDDNDEMISPKVVKKIKESPASIDYKSVFETLFYNVSYTDYLFSLPMGAGKTYLMAAFVYLDLYFAQNEPDNKAFAHNFIIFAPSGLKTSVVPSLKTIQHFDPSWIIPEPAASELKRVLIFEVLDQNKSTKKSNKTKNPNVQKIAIHQPLDSLFGLVAVTNAEKVILDRIQEKGGQINMFEESDDEKDRQANELRNLIGKLPQLSIFIDEVHHAATDNIKLRAVVTKWMQNKTLTGVVGFSGTPYLEKKERFKVTENLTISSSEITNIVNYYPLVKGIGNFLKVPTVKIATSNERLDITEKGLREFLEKYKDTVYGDGTLAKVGVYCGSIRTLEEQVYPLAVKIAEEYGLNPTESILKFHGGNNEYQTPVDSYLEFESLDKPFSKVRIVLLVQIGKEGWDCRSLTSIILSQEGDCSTNMVLQTSCRCLRQVERDTLETALIYLNESNAKTLNLQLEKQHHISLKEFERGNINHKTSVNRYDRTEYLKLPKLDFYQLKINYRTLVVKERLSVTENINESANKAKRESITKEAIINKGLDITGITTESVEQGRCIANFNAWLYSIIKEGFGNISVTDLKPFEHQLMVIFKTITYEQEGILYFSSNYDIATVNANIRKAFFKKRSFETREELIPEKASLLKIENFSTKMQGVDPYLISPDEETAFKIVLDDRGELKLDAKTQKLLEVAIETEQTDIAEMLRKRAESHPMKDKSFHYLPYKADSRFEVSFFEELLKLDVVRLNGLEVYYNGDRLLTEFKIKCYKKKEDRWSYIGMYTPDFLVIKRKDNRIYKVVIIETKGQIYAKEPSFLDKRSFVETTFKHKNNESFGYLRFDYLYIEDSLSDSERLMTVTEKIESFFKEEIHNGN